MSNLTPFEIRLELLKMAKDMLVEEYYGKRDQLQEDWRIRVEVAKLNGGAIPDHPAVPAYPSETDVINKAKELNGFVSNTPTDKVSKKSA
jgi:hypothetical protein